jgi:hypothetical protein
VDGKFDPARIGHEEQEVEQVDNRPLAGCNRNLRPVQKTERTTERSRKRYGKNPRKMGKNTGKITGNPPENASRSGGTRKRIRR